MSEKNSEELKKLLETTREDLKGLEKYVQEFSDFMPLPVCTANPLGVLIDVNKAFRFTTNYREMKIVGKKAKVVFKDKKKFEKFQERLLQKEKREITKEMTLLTKDEKEIPVKVNAAIRKDEEGEVIGYFLALFDITQFKKFQEKLEKKVEKQTEEVQKRTEELTKSRKALMNILEDVEAARSEAEEERDKVLAIIENFPEGILFLNKENKVSSVNSRIGDFFEIESQDLEEKTVSELMEMEKLEPLMDMVGKELKEVSKEEIEMREDLILELSTIKIKRQQQKAGTLITVRDITREKLVQKMKTEFVSIAAHQLRTPLSAIKWSIKMLLEGDAGELSEKQENLLDKSYKSNERMIRLINDLLNVSRIEEGKFLSKTQKENLVEVIKNTVESLRKVAERKGLDFKVNLPKEAPKPWIDSEKISLTVKNLVENAIHYTDEGKVKVSLKVQKDKGRFLFSVEDSGIGIPKDQQHRIFSKFFRADSAVKSETEGTGLGLFIAKNIIEAHNGSIWFESTQGEGTTFYFSLSLEGKKQES